MPRMCTQDTAHICSEQQFLSAFCSCLLELYNYGHECEVNLSLQTKIHIDGVFLHQFNVFCMKVQYKGPLFTSNFSETFCNLTARWLRMTCFQLHVTWGICAYSFTKRWKLFSHITWNDEIKGCVGVRLAGIWFRHGDGTLSPACAPVLCICRPHLLCEGRLLAHQRWILSTRARHLWAALSWSQDFCLGSWQLCQCGKRAKKRPSEYVLWKQRKFLPARSVICRDLCKLKRSFHDGNYTRYGFKLRC